MIRKFPFSREETKYLEQNIFVGEFEQKTQTKGIKFA
nr:hypothetical protein MarFTME_318 [Marseillevirus futianmevirus]